MSEETLEGKASLKDAIAAQIRERLSSPEGYVRGLIDRLASTNRLSQSDAQALHDDLRDRIDEDQNTLLSRLDDIIKGRLAILDLPERKEARELRARLVAMIERAEALEAKLLANGQD